MNWPNCLCFVHLYPAFYKHSVGLFQAIYNSPRPALILYYQQSTTKTTCYKYNLLAVQLIEKWWEVHFLSLPGISCVFNWLIAEPWSVISFYLLQDKNDTKCTIELFCEEGVMLSTCCLQPGWLVKYYFAPCLQVVVFAHCQVIGSSISVFCSGCNCLISSPQYLHWLTLKWTDWISGHWYTVDIFVTLNYWLFYKQCLTPCMSESARHVMNVLKLPMRFACTVYKWISAVRFWHRNTWFGFI